MAEAKLNRLNLTEKDYEGAPSTMCRGCGHDAISASVMRAYFDTLSDLARVANSAELSLAFIQMHSLRAFWSLLLPWPPTTTTRLPS